MVRRVIALVVLALPSVACQGAVPPARPAPITATSVGASFGRVWDAVIDDFATNNVPIKTVDRSSGIIVTETPGVPLGIAGYADCGRDIMGPALFPTHVGYNVLVRGDSSAATVRVNARWTRTGMARGMSTATVTEECGTTGKWENEFQSRIKAAAERR